MSVLSFFSEIRRLAKWAYTQYRVRKDPVGYARSIGVNIGERSHIYGGDIGTFGGEPYLVTLGNDVHGAHDVRFITHEGMGIVLRGRYPDLDHAEPIQVGNNVAIGMRAIILPGVKIGNNCVIGCASVVNRDVPDNSIAAGVPARVVGTLEDFERKMLAKSTHTGGMDRAAKHPRFKELFSVEAAGKVAGDSIAASRS